MQRTWSDSQLKEAISTSSSYTETLTKLGLRPYGANITRIKARVECLGLTTDHFQITLSTTKSLAEVLKDGVQYDSYTLKLRLLASGQLSPRCYICQLTKWQGQDAPLHLDHINGKATDNRIENLRLLCPNCHAQTDTYCGKNNKLKKKYEKGRWRPLCACGEFKAKSAKACLSCSLKNRPTKIDWPPTAELKALVAASSYVSIGRKLNVTDNAVRKRIKNH